MADYGDIESAVGAVVDSSLATRHDRDPLGVLEREFGAAMDADLLELCCQRGERAQFCQDPERLAPLLRDHDRSINDPREMSSHHLGQSQAAVRSIVDTDASRRGGRVRIRRRSKDSDAEIAFLDAEFDAEGFEQTTGHRFRHCEALWKI